MVENSHRETQMNKRPVSISIIACLFAAVGVVAVSYHATEFTAGPIQYDLVLVCLVRLFAIVCGVFLWRGRNWARWGVIVWLAYHVILSAFHNLGEVAMHALLLAIIAWFLFRPSASAWFRRRRVETIPNPA
jgi:hypothetical protein